MLKTRVFGLNLFLLTLYYNETDGETVKTMRIEHVYSPKAADSNSRKDILYVKDTKTQIYYQ